MTADQEIRKNMKKLKLQAIKRGGIWENFGQKEVRKMRDKYGDIGLVDDFDKWAMNMDDSQLQQDLD